jgi:hypothetical protein
VDLDHVTYPYVVAVSHPGRPEGEASGLVIDFNGRADSPPVDRPRDVVLGFGRPHLIRVERNRHVGPPPRGGLKDRGETLRPHHAMVPRIVPFLGE